MCRWVGEAVATKAGAKAKQLTAERIALRAKVHELARLGNSSLEIEKVLGLRPKQAAQMLRAAVVIDGLAPIPERAASSTFYDAKHPAEAGELAAVVAMKDANAGPDGADRFDGLKKICQELGLKPAFANAMVRRLRNELSPVREEARRLTLTQMTEEIEKKLTAIFSYMDDVSMSQASLKDLAIATGILIEKRELLNNRPTQIIDFTSRLQVQQMLPRMMAEAKRRGIVVDVTPEVVQQPVLSASGGGS